MKQYPECGHCLCNQHKRFESIGCKCNQIRYAFNKMILELPLLKQFAYTHMWCKHYSKDLHYKHTDED